MKVAAAVFAVALLFNSMGYSVQDFYAALRGSVVQLDLVTTHGFVITGGNGFIPCDMPQHAITAWHVATIEGKEIKAIDISQFGAGGKFGTQFIYRSDKTDIAIVRIPHGMVPKGCLQLGALRWGRDAPLAYYAAGLPYFDVPLNTLLWSDFWKSLNGEISSCCKSYRDLVTDIGGRWGALAHGNMPVWSGVSGSPVIQGEKVVGIIVGSLAAGTDSLIVPSYQIEEAIKSAKESILR